METITNTNKLSSLVSELREKEILSLVDQSLKIGIDPMTILDQCYEGMIQVGKFYEEGRYFISGLIMAGEIMQEVGQMVLPLIGSRHTDRITGKIVLGTIEGDVHDIGKDIFKDLAQIHGFTIHDIGIDVPANRFLSAIEEFKPDIVGISCLITAVYGTMKETIAFLRMNVKSEISPKAYVIGGRVNEIICKEVGADYWTKDAIEGLKICQKIIESRT